MINYFIAPLSDIQTLNIKYLTMCIVHMQGGTIRTLLYGCAYVYPLTYLFKVVLSSLTYAQTIH